MHLALDGEGPPSFAMWIGRLCEEFSCLPSEAFREARLVRDGLLEEILEARGYARAKQLSDGATTKEARDRLPKTKLMALVTDIEVGLAKQAYEERRRQIDGPAAQD